MTTNAQKCVVYALICGHKNFIHSGTPTPRGNATKIVPNYHRDIKQAKIFPDHEAAKSYIRDIHNVHYREFHVEPIGGLDADPQPDASKLTSSLR